MTHEKLRKFNRIFLRVTWIFLGIGLIDHFSCELEATRFACEFLPHGIAHYNLMLIWVMAGILVAGEIAAFIMKRKNG